MTELRWRGRDDASLDLVGEDHPLPVQDLGLPARASVLRTGQVVVLTSATLIRAANPLRKRIEIKQITGTQIAYVGTNNQLTTATGHSVGAAAGSSVVLEYTGEVWGIAAVAQQTISWAEEQF